MGAFKMRTDVVHSKGVNIGEQADEFGYNLRRIEEIVNGIVSSSFTSPEAKDIAAEVNRHAPALKSMLQTLERYGEFAIYASNLTEQTSDDISGMI